jgi:hypothetical protein
MPYEGYSLKQMFMYDTRLKRERFGHEFQDFTFPKEVCSYNHKYILEG